MIFNRKPKAYISGPITGMHNPKEVFKKVELKLQEDGWNPINPMRIKKPSKELNNEAKWIYYMRECVKLLPESDAIFMLPEWKGSSGANLELYLATALKIPIYYLQDTKDLDT